MEAMGRASGCYNDPSDAPGFEGKPSPYSGCQSIINGYGTASMRSSGGYGLPSVSYTYIYDAGVRPRPNDYYGRKEIFIDYIHYPSGDRRESKWIYDYKNAQEPPYWNTRVEEGTCEIEVPGSPIYPPHAPNEPIAPPYEYTDPETECVWQIQATDSYINSAGQPIFLWTATSNDPENCGGPYQWWGNGQEPNVPTFEDPRGPDVPPRPPTLPPGPSLDIKRDIDKIREDIEKLKECACPENPVQEGDYRTISFRSDETSPYGKSRLRKRFKYRSQSGLDLGAVVDHWKDFSFASGPVCVKHRGSALGSPQVWAASIDEGKRVIRHAGGEAGINPDQIGKWRIGGSDNSRYGVSDTMRVDTTGGYYWITARDGSDARPIVARV